MCMILCTPGDTNAKRFPKHELYTSIHAIYCTQSFDIREALKCLFLRRQANRPRNTTRDPMIPHSLYAMMHVARLPHIDIMPSWRVRLVYYACKSPQMCAWLSCGGGGAVLMLSGIKSALLMHRHGFASGPIQLVVWGLCALKLKYSIKEWSVDMRVEMPQHHNNESNNLDHYIHCDNTQPRSLDDSHNIASLGSHELKRECRERGRGGGFH